MRPKTLDSTVHGCLGEERHKADSQDLRNLLKRQDAPEEIQDEPISPKRGKTGWVDSSKAASSAAAPRTDPNLVEGNVELPSISARKLRGEERVKDIATGSSPEAVMEELDDEVVMDEQDKRVHATLLRHLVDLAACTRMDDLTTREICTKLGDMLGITDMKRYLPLVRDLVRGVGSKDEVMRVHRLMPGMLKNMAQNMATFGTLTIRDVRARLGKRLGVKDMEPYKKFVHELATNESTRAEY